ncbi:tetratricopeptide repeat protein [Chitinibacter tainanensis]|uniref:tetratricopeptide repeat protein n=1 Tax=Chitinibacter tainanensis TaxID=230667 RepID=UPI0023537D6A|nr:tetratricopeptide repeat protein [Chitinibacter tainanensis]
MQAAHEYAQQKLELQTILQDSACGRPPSTYIALQLMQSTEGQPELAAIACLIQGHAWQHISEHAKAQMAFAAGMEGFRQLGMAAEECDASILLGMSYLLAGEPQKALDQWSNALQLARKLSDRGLICRVYLGVGQVYIGFNDIPSALAFNELALELARLLNDDQRKGEALLNVASDAYRLGRYNYTLQCIAEAEKLLQSTVTNAIWSAEVVYYRGLVHTRQQHYAQARAELETAYMLSDRNDNLWGKAHALTALGELLLLLDDPSAGETLSNAFGLASGAQLQALMQRCATGLVGWYKQQDQHEAALPYYAVLLAPQQSAAANISPAYLRQIQARQAQSRIRWLEAQVAG